MLVADDHPVNLEVILRQLELLGLSAEIAEDGAAALAKWRKAPHDVVLLDLHMPVLDGFGLAKAIRHEEAKRGLPRTALVAVTADAMKGKDARCLRRGHGRIRDEAGFDRRAGSHARALGAKSGRDASGRATRLTARFSIRRRCAPCSAPTLRGSPGTSRTSPIAPSAISRRCTRRVDAKQVAAFAHRLKGAARVAGATLMAEQAARVEAAAEGHDLAGARRAAVGMEELLADTIEAMRSVA